MKRFGIIFAIILLFHYSICIEDADIIQLPEPEKEGGMPLYEALSKRQSLRNFTPDKKIDIKVLSQALWSCYGVNRSNGLLTTPSATGWHPLIVYVFIEEGVYKYVPSNHSLIRVLSGDYREMTGTQTKVVTTASVNFVLIADFMKKSSMDGDDEHKLRSIYLDTGHCTMALGLFAAANNMKGVDRAMVDVDPLLQLLGLQKGAYIFTLSYSLGY